MFESKQKIIRLSDVRPKFALQQLNRSTGLRFVALPENLATHAKGDSPLLKKSGGFQ